MGRFDGQVALVTGGTSGIGEATAEELAREGATVVVAGRSVERGLAVAARLEALGARARFAACDVSQPEDCQRAAEVAAELGRLSILVNNAGEYIMEGADASPETWARALDVNVKGYVFMTQAALPALRAGGGAIVNVSSISAHTAQRSRWTYSAGKGAISTLTRCMALDLAKDGIRVNAVSPAWIWTPPVLEMARGDKALHNRLWGRYHMLGRCGEAVEVARCILFLCSQDASFVTGTDLPVDGGYMAMGHETVAEP
ncbi:MAG: glucose 1-dehydrogenase [Chloroflexi bacterium]|nr:glucose 1-dehydrogenase [Chloroflexota bacterium]